MKSISPIFFSLVLFAISLTGCNNDTATSDKPPSNNLNEAELPKGKQVIEDNVSPVVNNNTTVPLGGNTAKNNTTTTDRPVQETQADKLKKRFKNLLVFHLDDTMTVDKPKLATLILSKDETFGNIKLQVLDASDATDEKVIDDATMDFGNKMRAKLVPFGGNKIDNNFEIEALGDDMQSFKNDRKKIIWQWKVTPLKSGQQELKLSIQIIEKDGEAVSLPAKNIPVIIFAKNENFFSRAGDFFEKKYEWIIGIMVAIITAWIGGRARSRNYKQPPQQHHEKNTQA